MAEAPSELSDFLKSVNPSFAKYAEKLVENGLSAVDELGIMQDEDFKYLGIPLFHWRQIVAKARAQQGGGGATGATSSESLNEGEDEEPAAASPRSAGSSGGGDSKKKSNPAAGWSNDEVCLWVGTLEDGQYREHVDAFRKANIDGLELIGISGVKELKSIISDLGARYGIYQNVEELQDGTVPSIKEMLAIDAKLKKQGGASKSDSASASAAMGGTEWRQSGDPSAIKSKSDSQNLFVKSKEQSSVRARLIKFYEIYNPEKLNDMNALDDLLRRYQGKEKQLFQDLEQKYILGAPTTTYKRKEIDRSKQDESNLILTDLSKMYHAYVRPIEKAFEFAEFHTPLLDKVDFLAAPMVMLVGQYSVGKTTFIRYLVGRDFPGIRIGPEPTTDAFGAIMHGHEERQIPGHTVPMDREKPFRTLQQFGAGFLNKFSCAEVPSPLLESITFIDTPGILSGEKQRLGRNYEFAKVVEWFAYKSDRILLLFDAHKLDISDEFKSSIEMLKGHDDKIRCVLNKADAVTNQQLLRVYGALMWSLGKVFKTPEVLRVYVGSFWDQPYSNPHNAELFDSEADDLLSDLRGLPRHCATRKINEFVKRTRQLRVHCLIIEHMRKQFGFFGKEKKQKKMLDNLKTEFRGIAKEYGLHLADFPNPNKFRQLIQKFDISKFPKYKDKWRQGIDTTLNERVPALMKKLPGSGASRKKEEKGGGGPTTAFNPFGQESAKEAKLDPTKKWAVSGIQKSKFDTQFYKLELLSGKASGAQVMNVMLQSGLSRDVLKKIWDLSDIDLDGKMDHEEFALCLYLIDMVKGGIKLPPTLPLALIPPTKRELVEYE